MKSFKTKDVVIRRFKKSDVDKIYINKNQAYNTSNLCYENIHKSKDETQRIIESAMIEYYTEEPIWAVEAKKTKDLLGFIKVDNYSAKNKVCNISWSLSTSDNNKNVVTDALKEVVSYLFSKKGIELIECSYYDENEKTGEILSEVGMKKEAVLKHRRFNKETNKKEDYIIYSIELNEFQKCRN